MSLDAGEIGLASNNIEIDLSTLPMMLVQDSHQEDFTTRFNLWWQGERAKFEYWLWNDV